MRLADYLDRIGFRGSASPTLDTLRGVLRHHVLTVPFEALDVQLGRRLTTDVEAAYEKIVVDRRGGWCYEQNGLFGWALGEMGYGVTRVAGAVMRAERGPVSDANHLTLLVESPDAPGRRFLADVGFGGSMIEPIELTESRHWQTPFDIGLRRLADGHWQFQEDAADGIFSFDFKAEAGDEQAMAARCEVLQTDPESGFVKSLVAQLRLPDAHRNLRGRLLKTIGPNGTETRLLDNADELVDTLSRLFGLDVPGVGDLWPRIVTRHEEFLREQAAAAAAAAPD